MPYDKNRALELGGLINAAYAQYAQQPNWQPPGYQIVSTFTRPVQGQNIPFGYIATLNGTAYVIVRGTEQALEWLDDAAIVPVAFRPNWGNCASGFSLIYTSLSNQILPVLQNLKSQGAYASLYVAGHSLGGALTHLIAADIFLTLGDKPISYTFCGPRTGDKLFSEAFIASGLETWRIVNTEDIVPTLPLAALDLNHALNGLNDSAVELAIKMLLHTNQLGYYHLQTPVAVTFNLGTIADNHSLTNLCARL